MKIEDLTYYNIYELCNTCLYDPECYGYKTVTLTEIIKNYVTPTEAANRIKDRIDYLIAALISSNSLINPNKLTISIGYDVVTNKNFQEDHDDFKSGAFNVAEGIIKVVSIVIYYDEDKYIDACDFIKNYQGWNLSNFYVNSFELINELNKLGYNFEHLNFQNIKDKLVNSANNYEENVCDIESTIYERIKL